MSKLRRKRLEILKKELSDLNTEEYHEILETIVQMMKQKASTSGKTRSLLELRGLGKEIWQDVDVEEYINQERDSWD